LESTYEAQAAIELEMSVGGNEADGAAPYAFGVEETTEGRIVRLEPTFDELIRDAVTGCSVGAISARFHQTLACMVAAIASLIRQEQRLSTVALSGGCFQNRLLLRLCTAKLRTEGFDVLVHRKVPSNDGGISLGQAVVAGARMIKSA
jgi:hydrogenase maturation protein HypF